jgi:hypothetical protein
MRVQQLDGTHPWRDVSPDGFVDYPVRCRSQGRVLYFNFPLAKELELIPPDHPSIINKELEQVILENILAANHQRTRSQQSARSIRRESNQAQPYMATRYLQTQHHNKQGKTSGDGRSIWNGCSENEATDV